MTSLTQCTTTAPRFFHRMWVRWAFLFGVWTLPALLFASQHYVMYNRPGSRFVVPYSKVLTDQLMACFFWALLTPFMLLLAHRFFIDRKHWARNMLLHVVASFFFALLQRAFTSAYSAIFPVNPNWIVTPQSFFREIYMMFDYGVLIYWVILLVVHAQEYYRRFREGQLRAAQLEMRLAQAQLQALKMQLHPHFLFNTLHSISALMNKDIRLADKMIARLGDFLRMTLDNTGTQKVSLHQELDFLRCYLEIEQIRFQDRLTVRIDIDPQAEEAEVPNLILQPIVENAIQHGISPKTGPGLIEIEAFRDNGRLLLQVSDNGPGIADNQATFNKLKQGVGLSNTQARLQQLYGDDYEFDLGTNENHKFVVTLKIPFENARSAAIRENVFSQLARN